MITTKFVFISFSILSGIFIHSFRVTRLDIVFFSFNNRRKLFHRHIPIMLHDANNNLRNFWNNRRKPSEYSFNETVSHSFQVKVNFVETLFTRLLEQLQFGVNQGLEHVYRVETRNSVTSMQGDGPTNLIVFLRCFHFFLFVIKQTSQHQSDPGSP